MQIVYVLKSEKDCRLYVGCTENIENRLEEHNRGLVRSTKHRKPFKLIHAEMFEDKKKAFEIERFYKTATGKRQLKLKLGLQFHKYSEIV